METNNEEENGYIELVQSVNDFLEMAGLPNLLMDTPEEGDTPVEDDTSAEEAAAKNALFEGLYTPEEVLRLICNGKYGNMNIEYFEPLQIQCIINAANVLLEMGFNELD